MYNLIKSLLFKLDPETAHHVGLRGIQFMYQLGLKTKIDQPCKIMGLEFSNPIGLAAGLDKNADYIDALAALGFGFIEVGTLTPKPQEGNPKPRLFRLTAQEAIINRMGFNNKGIDYAVTRFQKMRYRGILGINIGKNKTTPNEQAINDYIYSFKKAAPYASYITINISSPNTPDLRQLQHGESLRQLLNAMKQEQAAFHKYIPLVVKIAPDLTSEELQQLAAIISEYKIDGVIATNTTLSREGFNTTEAGGLSGKPLLKRSTDITRELYHQLPKEIPIIASGGVMSTEAARQKFAAGAQLVQIYSGMIYKGPALIKDILSCKNLPSG